MDTSGKGGAIRKAFEGLDPTGRPRGDVQGADRDELAHDFLWRIHPHVPEDGHITIFDRSHYEDVLIVRVHDLVPEARWRARYDHIRDFEQMLADEGTVDPQVLPAHLEGGAGGAAAGPARRPDQALEVPHGGPGRARATGTTTSAAYEEAIRRTAAPHAPVDRGARRPQVAPRLVICRTMVETLEGLDLRYRRGRREGRVG